MKGRGSGYNPFNRFDDVIIIPDQVNTSVETRAIPEQAVSLITYNQSPDISFDASVNPYRGCEHGCAYCYARASHSFLGYSPGLDFETRIHYKENAAVLLRRELARRRYKISPIALGNNTDAYQPLENRLQVTRQVVQVLAETRHPLTIVTKSSRILRDLDLLAPMAAQNLLHVFISVTTLNNDLSGSMEPRACAPHKRLQTIARLRQAGVPVGVLLAPLIPGLNDSELEEILSTAASHGAERAAFVMLRLPYEVKEVFFSWLGETFPERVSKIRRHLQSLHAGREYRSEFGKRMIGQGPVAEILGQRFEQASKKYGLSRDLPTLRTDLFVPPQADHRQTSLF